MKKISNEDQIIKYFVILTEKRLNNVYGANETKILIETFETTFKDLYEKNIKGYNDPIAHFHIINPSFILALNKILESKKLSIDILTKHVIDIYETMMAEYYDPQVKMLENSKNPWKDIVALVKKGNAINYNNKYFELIEVIENKTEIGFDLNKCIYFDIFQKNKRPELGPILCEFDFILARTLSKWIVFERTETIASGGICCNFRLKNKNY
ncbi:MAG: L-2-amino-thiazoline-4-carboxylic acid hydrolase [Candidatus Hodarchaeales archaeon]